MQHWVLNRHILTPEYTGGSLFRESEKLDVLATLELPWKENQRRESCIPEGEYKVTHWQSKSHGHCLKIHAVHERSDILIHVGNYLWNTMGCVLVGTRFTFTGMGKPFLTRSRVALVRVLSWLKEDEDATLTVCSTQKNEES